MSELDPRLLRIGIEVNGGLKFYDQGFAVRAVGTKFQSSTQNECEAVITNLDKATQDYILTETSPYNFNKTPKKLVVEAGRKSYGTFRVFTGEIISSKPSQPPDIAVMLRALTGAFLNGNVVSRNQPASTPLSKISQQIATDNNLALNFKATDKGIANYSYSGGSLNQIEYLSKMGLVNAYNDDETLVVKDQNVPANGSITIISKETGMIGIPELTELGVKVKFFIDNKTILGSAIQIISSIYPAANGIYYIYKLSFELASRDIPFYYIAEGSRHI